MITRPVSHIANQPLTAYTAMDIDPHGQFIAVYLPTNNTVQIVRTCRLTIENHQFAQHFRESHQYIESIKLQSDAFINSGDLYSDHCVQKIVISTMFRLRQIICVSNLFSIKLFSVRFDSRISSKISLKSKGEVLLHRAQPVQTFFFHQKELWVSFLNGNFDVYRKDGTIWEPIRPREIKNESVRLLAYKQYSNKARIYEVEETEKNKQERQKLYNKKSLKSRLSRSKKLIVYRMSIQTQNKNQIVLTIPDQKNRKPLSHPTIIYLSKQNTLCKAQWCRIMKQYETQELCATYKKPSSFLSLLDEYKYEQMKNEIPIPYIVSSGRDFIVCSEKQGYSVRSKRYEWQQVLKDDRMPTICPFFDELQISILKLITINMSKENARKAINIILCKYQFFLVIFSKEDDLYREPEEEQSSINFELIAVTKKFNRRERKIYKMLQNGKEPPFYHFSTKRLYLTKFQMDTLDPDLIRWISPTELVYFAKKFNEPYDRLYYLKIEEQLLLSRIKRAFEFVLFDEWNKTADEDEIGEMEARFQEC